MKESYSEDLASHTVPELYAGDGNIVGVATTGVHAGQILSSDITCFVCRRSAAIGRQYQKCRFWQDASGHGGVRDPEHVWKLQAREPGDPVGFPSCL
jgi:hypothetical protein